MSRIAQETVLGHIMATNPPAHVASGEMTPAQWASEYMTHEDGYVLMPVSPTVLESFLPCPAGDPSKAVSFAALDGGEVPAVVLDRNAKLLARPPQGGGVMECVVLDGKHRVIAALKRGDKSMLAYVPLSLVSRISAWSHNAEMQDWWRGYCAAKGTPSRCYDVRLAEMVAAKCGHTWLWS